MGFQVRPEELIPQYKKDYAKRMRSYIESYKTWMFINVDMVGSRQMQEVRIVLRGRAIILLGKNTVMRKVVRDLVEEDPKYEQLLPLMKGNMGMVFTNEDPVAIREVIESNKVPAAARVGIVAPVDVFIPPGATGLDPGQTSFFQALNIATKIVRGSIELMNQVHLCKKGERVSPSAVSLLQKMNKKPFFFAINVLTVFEKDTGSLYGAEILDITDDILLGKFFGGVNKLASLSLAIGVPNLATLPHSFGRAIKYAVAIAVETDVTFEIAQKYKDYLADPAAYAAAHGLSSGPAAGGAAAAAAPEPEPEPEEEEEDEDMGFSLFD